ncbi:MAG: 4Fe-4S dicluster domain-containing protein [Magnetococcus sp. THC-1_WYH]
MDTFWLQKEAAPQWIRSLAQRVPLFFPQRSGRSGWRFKEVHERSELSFENYRPTLIPPGKKLFPAQETLFRFHPDEAGEPIIEPVVDPTSRILAGVRPCDLKAIDLMDRVHRHPPEDPHYRARRDPTTLIAIDCPHPCDERCFCDATGSLHWRGNADLFLTPIDDSFLVEVQSEAGASLIDGQFFQLCHDATPHKIRAEAARPKPFGRQFPQPLEHLAATIAAQWSSPIWERHVQRCFSCGSCNLVCPTCYCFDTHDEPGLTNPHHGQRVRTWDACMLPRFAEVAGGHNFRPLPAGRQRHRVERKFEYLPQRFGEPSFCVGCGRCGRQCTANIDIFSIVLDLVLPEEARS